MNTLSARLLRLLALATLVTLTLAAFPARAQNVIQAENAKRAGVTTQWQIPDASYASNQEIEGYASATSVNRGGSLSLFVQTQPADTSYTIQIYRIGWYGGAGGRQVAGPITRARSAQPACPLTDAATNLVECNWIDPYVLTVPNNTSDATDWASGIYLAKLTGAVSGKQSYITFAVRDDARPSAILFQQSVVTYAAYNTWGGFDFYTPLAQKVSFDRPYSNPERHLNGKGAGDFLSWEINTLRFVEREGYDVTYSTNIDTHVAPGRLLTHRMFMSVGHDEYYTKAMYDAVEGARNAGVNLGFFGANSIYWQVRLEPSLLTGVPNRTVVGYKYNADPLAASQPTLATYLWRETARAPINRPEAALVGVMYDYNSVDLDMVIADCSSWACAGTNVTTGHVLRGMLGYEVDRVAPSSPAGISVLTSSPYDACINTTTCTTRERRFANTTVYTAANGAGVFGAGSMQWNWGLDAYTPGPRIAKQDEHDDRSNAVVQQITRNVLTRFSSVAGNSPPQITSAPVTSASTGAAYAYPVVASDPNGGALTFSLAQAPAGMTISGNGLITWTPGAAQSGSYPVTVRVADPGGLAATQSFSVAISGWVRCATEGTTCNFTGTRTVRYGANGVYVTRTVTGSVVCSYLVFGDPLPGVNKQCDFENAPAAGATSAPVFSLAPGSYAVAQAVTLSSPTAGATIYYSLTGSPPTTASPQYVAPLTINTTATLQAFAVSTGRSNSPIVSATYTIGAAAGGWTRCAGEGQTCTFSGTRSVRYGANGVYATRTATGSIVCSYLIFGDPLKGVNKQCDVQDSTTVAAAAAPAFSPAPGSYTGPVTLTLGTPTAGAAIFYTTDGSTPTPASARYTAPLAITTSTTVQALAVATGLANSSVASGAYAIGAAGAWTRCATEGIACNFSGTRTVRYGANGVFATRTATGSIVCSYLVFGDPLPGVNKQCDYQ